MQHNCFTMFCHLRATFFCGVSTLLILVLSIAFCFIPATDTYASRADNSLLPPDTTVLKSVVDTVFSRRVTVIDAETHLPIREVTIKTDGILRAKTDYRGRVNLTERFDSISFTHVGYDTETVSFIEVGDTMVLFPRHNVMEEVVVMGISPDLRNAMKKSHERMMEEPVVKGLTFDFGMMLDKRARRDRKHLKKAKQILRDWDLAQPYTPQKENK